MLRWASLYVRASFIFIMLSCCRLHCSLSSSLISLMTLIYLVPTRPVLKELLTFYKRFHEKLFFFSLSLPPSHLSCRKHEGTSAKVTVTAEYQFQHDTSTHCQGASLRERTPSVCSPQADPPAREGERKRANSDALLIQWWHWRGGLARPPACPVMTSPPLGFDLCSHFGRHRHKKETQSSQSPFANKCRRVAHIRA